MGSQNNRKSFILNFLQWNSQSLRSKLISFENMLCSQKIHIALISETWLNMASTISVSGYNIYRCDRNDGYGGVAIIVHKSIRSYLSPFHLRNSGIEVLHVKLINCPDLHNVISIYCPSSVSTVTSDWEELFSRFRSKSLVAGDFNAHHSSWSCRSDARGTQLWDAALEHGMMFLNDGTSTRIKLVNGYLQHSSPDIAFVSADISVKFDWQVTNENLGSDHLIIKIRMNYVDFLNFVSKRNIKLANWEKYSDYLIKSFSNKNFKNNVQHMYDFLIQEINLAADQCIPFYKICTNPSSSFKPKAYWVPELSLLVAQRRLALKDFRRNPIPSNLSRLESKIEECAKKTKEARTKSWCTFCDSIDEEISAPDLWSKMRWFKGYKRKTVYFSDEKKIELLKSLTPDFSIPVQPDFVSQNKILESDFSLQELESCLKKRDTAPGHDAITYSMIYHTPVIVREYILRLFNLILDTGHVPAQWRDIHVLPIPKPSPDVNSEPKLRPISLINCFCKLFHCMLGKRIEWFVEKQKLFSPYTVGFRKAQSCVDSLTRLVCQIQSGFHDGTPTAACFLDVEGAYNNVLVDIMIKILDQINVGSKICNYLFSFLSERHLFIFLNNGKSKVVRWTYRGLAQGDPISPLLFNIATYKIFSNIAHVTVSQYADDLVLYLSEKDSNLCGIYLQDSLDVVVDALRKVGLEVSASKSKLCVFNKSKKVNVPTLYVNNQVLPLTSIVKYLGMWLDRGLTWGKHINEIIQRCSKFLNLLKVLVGSSWGIHTVHVRRLYIALIRSRMEYGCILFDSSAQTHLSKLDKLQNQAMRVIGGFIKSTPIHVMESELCIVPLYLRRSLLAYKFCLKSQSWSNKITVNSIKDLASVCTTNYWSKKGKPLLVKVFSETQDLCVFSSDPLPMFSLDIWMSAINIKSVIAVNLDCVIRSKESYELNSIKLDVKMELYKKYSGWDLIFTDGSKSVDGIGAALYHFNSGFRKCFKIINQVSVMSAELVAISEALTFVLSKNFDTCVVLSDCKSALQHIISCVFAHRSGVSVAYDVVRKIAECRTKGINLKLQWVPSHIGLRGNDVADELARQAAINGLAYKLDPNYSELFSKFKIKIYLDWKEYFDKRSLTKGIWYRTIISEPPRVPWFIDYKFPRKVLKVLMRLRSGHLPFNKFAFLMRKVQSSKCELCEMEEDAVHVLEECRRNSLSRAILEKSQNLNRFSLGVYQFLLSRPNVSQVYLIYQCYLEFVQNRSTQVNL